MVSKLIHFITTDIWRIQLKNVSRTRSFFIKQLRIILLALRGFDEDKCQLRASALTFYSLLSIVPVLAMVFGVAKGFGFEKLLEKQLLEKFPTQQEVFSQIIAFANQMLENTKGGLVAGIGVAVLFWTVIKVLGNIERSFNDIWGIKKTRSISRKFSDYLSIMLICPILVIVSSSLTVFISTQIALIMQKVSFLGAAGPFITLLLEFLPYVVIWVLFSFIYIFMPNTKVSLSSGILGGVIAGTIYQVVQWVYINFQIGVAKFNAIYGSFAALPLFLVWLQLSWLIVLLGAEISFAHQNVDTYEFEPDCLKASQAFKRLIAIYITQRIIKNFDAGKAPLTATALSHELEIPIRLVRELLFELTQVRILSEVKEQDNQELGFQPARDPQTLTIFSVARALENKGSGAIPVPQTEALTVVSDSLQAFAETIEKSPKNKLLKDI